MPLPDPKRSKIELRNATIRGIPWVTVGVNNDEVEGVVREVMEERGKAGWS